MQNGDKIHYLTGMTIVRRVGFIVETWGSTTQADVVVAGIPNEVIGGQTVGSTGWVFIANAPKTNTDDMDRNAFLLV